MEGFPLSEAFLAAAGNSSVDGDPALEAALRDYVRTARTRWPAFGIDDVEFVRHVGARASDGKLPPEAYAVDLLLACACCRGVKGAPDAFQREFGRVIDRVLAHRRASADVAADARQIVEERLLVGDRSRGTMPKLDAYRGAGPLRSWVATATATTLMMLRRSESRRREQPDDSPAAELGDRLDPELDFLKKRYKAEVEQAIVEALGQLSDRDRMLLRLHLGERLSIDALGSMYSVNRATAARWLTAARRALVDSARRSLTARLQLTSGECDSMVALVKSQLDVSIVRRLSEDDEPR